MRRDLNILRVCNTMILLFVLMFSSPSFAEGHHESFQEICELTRSLSVFPEEVADDSEDVEKSK